MIAKILRIIFFSLIIFYQNFIYLEDANSSNFNKKDISTYFSALVSLENEEYFEALKFFNDSKFLKESHDAYLKSYLFSLILNGKVSRAITEIKTVKDKKFSNFFESDLLLLVESLKTKNYKKSYSYINNLKEYQNRNTFERVLVSSLEEYIYIFDKNKINFNLKNNFGNLTLVNRAFQNCYLGKSTAESLFKQVINSPDGDYSRYLFFYINSLVIKEKIIEAENFAEGINEIDSSLIAIQTKNWIGEKKFKNFKQIFSCKNSNDIISELFYLIANLYASENNFKKSNFYFNISYYLNPKFKFNLSLLADNYYRNNNFRKSEKILKKFNNKDGIYYWYKIKKRAQIIKKENNSEKAFSYINSKFNSIKSPSLKIIFDMGNISKNFKKYEVAIEHYSNILSKINKNNSLIYSDILYRRGGSYERLGMFEKSDLDLLKSLEINSGDPYVLNYLAYSWLERNYKIDEAIKMLEEAYEQKNNDPYIIDSIGWAYYLKKDFIKAEKLLKKAVVIMPYDPIVNDHYGDILWKLDRRMQAVYFWKNVLTLDDTEEEMKEEIYYKLLNGPKKI